MGQAPSFPVPSDEAARLRALERYQIMDTDRDARFEALVAAVARECGVPIATIAFLDAERQWFKAALGMPVEQTQRGAAFCAHTIMDANGPMVVEDATNDPRFAGSTLVTGDPHVVAYAGAPVVTPDGAVIGTVCAMDVESRSYTPDQLASLRRVAAEVLELLEATSSAQRLLDGDVSVAGTDVGIQELADTDTEAADVALDLTRPLIEAIGEEVDILSVIEQFSRTVLEAFGWWAARVSWVQGHTLSSEAWIISPAAPPSLAALARTGHDPVELDDLTVIDRDPAVVDVGMLRWSPDRDLIVAAGARSAVVLDVPGVSSLAARIVLLVPSERAVTTAARRTLTTAAAVLPRVLVQDRARRELTYRASHDMLTGLLNRDGLAKRYPDAVDEHAVNRAVLFVDLDGFKDVNDTFGHRAGDDVLNHVARKILRSIRPTDTAARLGGDEFLIVLDGILHEDEALRVARRLLQSIGDSVTVAPGVTSPIAVSIGVALWTRAPGLSEAIADADALMYTAKDLGGSAIAVDGFSGRRLIGVDEHDERDLDAVLSGAIHAEVAPLEDADGRVVGTFVHLAAEVRRPVVDDLAEIIVEVVGEGRGSDGEPWTVMVEPAEPLARMEGTVERLLEELAGRLPDMQVTVVVDARGQVVRRSPRENTTAAAPPVRPPESPITSDVVVRLGEVMDLGLVDRLEPQALLLEGMSLSAGPDGSASSLLIAALAVAGQRDVRLVVEHAGAFATLDPAVRQTLVGSRLALVIIDTTQRNAHRRQAIPRGGAGRIRRIHRVRTSMPVGVGG